MKTEMDCVWADSDRRSGYDAGRRKGGRTHETPACMRRFWGPTIRFASQTRSRRRGGEIGIGLRKRTMAQTSLAAKQIPNSCYCIDILDEPFPLSSMSIISSLRVEETHEAEMLATVPCNSWSKAPSPDSCIHCICLCILSVSVSVLNWNDLPVRGPVCDVCARVSEEATKQADHIRWNDWRRKSLCCNSFNRLHSRALMYCCLESQGKKATKQNFRNKKWMTGICNAFLYNSWPGVLFRAADALTIGCDGDRKRVDRK